jgi:hypothetical protein
MSGWMALGPKDRAQAIAKRSRAGKARVVLARKLAVILHGMWRSGEPFRWSEKRRPPDEAVEKRVCGRWRAALRGQIVAGVCELIQALRPGSPAAAVRRR